MQAELYRIKKTMSSMFMDNILYRWTPLDT
jgi:hypothetical protein